MRIAVIGGTGEAGAPTVAALVRRGAQVVVVSRRPPAISGVEHRVADIATGEGLRAALEGAECVVHAANGRRNAAEVLIGGTERLFEAAEAAAVSHLAFISIVGCERVPFRYHRVKAEQERLIAASPVPWTVLRATQFHSLVASLFDATRRFGTLPGGAARLQPIDAAVTGEALADAALGVPAGRLPNLVGPQLETLTGLALAYRQVTGSRALRLPAPLPPRLRRALAGGALTDRMAEGRGPGFEAWLRERQAKGGSEEASPARGPAR